MTKLNELQNLKQTVLEEVDLPIKKTSTQIVFGVGNPDTEILFIGEAPGFYEDQKGEPFVGAAGILLNQTLEKINLKREDVFITNVVMYRPPNNRDPLPSELEAFDPFINKLIEIIKPKLIVTLGRFSMAKFVKDVKISQVHGKVYKVKLNENTFYVVPMYHPAAALRAGNVKELFEKDFLRLPKIIEKLNNV